jgi:hypothetical protein
MIERVKSSLIKVTSGLFAQIIRMKNHPAELLPRALEGAAEVVTCQGFGP